jgi:universal stress protein E
VLGLEKILVAVEQDDTAKFVLEKGVKLALAAQAELHVIRVTYDANVDAQVHDEAARHQLKTYLMEAQETWLDEFIEDVDRNVRLIESATIWHKDEYIGILDAAKDCQADMIIKACQQPQGVDAVVRTPQDWNLLRHSDIPVMMVKAEAWRRDPVVLCALDALHEDQEELNRRIIREGSQLAAILQGNLDIVVAHPFVQPFIGPNTVPIDFEKIRDEVERDIKASIERMVDLEDTSFRYLVIEEGATANAVGHQVDTSDAEILIMGTVARDGVKGFVLGNTSETILYRVQCDVAVLR